MDFFRSDGRRQAFIILLSGVILRTVLNLLFFTKYGWHSVNHTETWFYYGVAKGTLLPAYELMDPTVWLLQALGFIIPENQLFYAIVFLSTLLASLTGLMIYYLVREQHGREAAFASAMIYTSMIEPLALSLVGFTHDHLQLLLIAAALFCVVKAVKAKGGGRLFWGVLFIAIIYPAMFINESIYVGLGVAGLYVGYFVVEHLFSGRVKKKDLARIYPAYIAMVSVVIVIAGLTVVPHYISNMLESLPQGRYGSADVKPIEPSNFWLRNNILLFLIPLAIPIAVRRRDTIGITLTLTGFMLAFIFDRGTRISDLGVCMLAGHVITSWLESEKALLSWAGKPMAKALKRNNVGGLWIVLLVIAVPCLVYAYDSLDTRESFQNVFILASLGVVAASWKLAGHWRELAILSLLVLSSFTVNAMYVMDSDPRRIGYDTEYQFYRWLGVQGVDGRVLTRWDRGYMLESLSGMKSVSNPGVIRKNIHDSLWMPEKAAAIALSRSKVTHVMINSLNFNVVNQEGRMAYAISGGLVMMPDQVPPVELADHLAVYKLRHRMADPAYFRLVKSEVDPYTGVELMLYEVSPDLGAGKGRGVVVGAVMQNYGDGRQAGLKLDIVGEHGMQTYALNDSFEANELKDAAYVIPADIGNISNCSMRAYPLGDGGWGFKGTVAFRNTGDAGEYGIDLLLVDLTASQMMQKMIVESLDKRSVFFEKGEVKPVEFTFERKYPYHNYNIASGRNDGLEVLKEESVEPSNNGVEVFYVNCL
ncbi:MAG: glycosyltransferase family 39 protein [Candidatus Altiarchaeota archaeon]